MLNADPLFVGATYYESDGGNDTTPDVFEVTFEGGSETTRLSSVQINTNAHVVFDTEPGEPGAPQSFGFQLDEANSIGITGADILNVGVHDGGHALDISIANFQAGDKLVFTVDVDHQLAFSTDPIASAAEFELSTLDVTFTDPNFAVDSMQSRPNLNDPAVVAGLRGSEHGIFWNAFDDNLVGTGLSDNLRSDNFTNPQGHGQADRTNAAVIGFDLTPLPITLSGTVFHDHDLDLVQDGADEGITGVQLSLFYKQNENDSYQQLLDSTGQPVSTNTDANGDYSFGVDDGLVLFPGFYRVVQSQPTDFDISVGAIPGQVTPDDGQPMGAVDANDPTNIITDIQIPFGNRDAVDYDFAEAKPVSISGTVFHDRDLDLDQDAGDEGIADAQLALYFREPGTGQYQPVVDGSGQPVTTRTDANGDYSFGVDDGLVLLPGVYRVVEAQPSAFPLSVGAVPGSVDGQSVGQLDPSNPTNVISEINISLSGQDAVFYDFAEAKPVSISGTVFHDRDMDLTRDPEDAGIANAQLSLFYKLNQNDPYQPVVNSSGQPVTTLTDANGQYSFGINDGLALRPGYYRVVESQPADFELSVGALPGTIEPGGGSPVGQVDSANPTNVITEIHIPQSDQDAVRYDFAEANPIEIRGNVHLSDSEGECYDPGHPNHRPIEGVRVYLVSDQGDVLDTVTDSNGNYAFTGSNLLRGTYTIIEVTPVGLIDGGQSAGTAGGVGADQLTQIQLADGSLLAVADIVEPDQLNRLDFITDIRLLSGDHGEQYNFCEHEFSSISGHVFVDANNNGQRDAGEGPVTQSVQIKLLDQEGNQIATALTSDQGFYRFDGLLPGVYTVVEMQPDGYFDGKEHIGTVNVDGVPTHVGDWTRTPDGAGVLRDSDRITQIELGFGQHGVTYDFGELPPAVLSGFVFHDANENGVFDDGETPIGDVEMELRLTFGSGDLLLTDSHVLDDSVLETDGSYVVTTDSNGFYRFTGLRGGAIELEGGEVLPSNYTVYQNDQPLAYEDGLDSAGSTGGLADNQHHDGQPANSPFLNSLVAAHTSQGARSGDLLTSIALGVGQSSENNNFGEVLPPLPPAREVSSPPASFLPPLVVTLPPPRTVPAPLIVTAQGGAPGTRAILLPIDVGVSLSASDVRFVESVDYSWHLSVVNAGTPRGDNFAPGNFAPGGDIWRSASYLDRTDWTPDLVRYGQWTLDAPDPYAGTDSRQFIFGIHGSIPIVGDFDGDGVDEIGVFYQGEWFLDLNGNGQWDEHDLWAKLGDGKDRPVTGDWDGDGKDDIGIFGPRWNRDEIAIATDPGLPDPEGMPKMKPKNVPPQVAEATSGMRQLRLTAEGRARSDVIDHVLSYGAAGDMPVAGDWNGDGISGIGVFRDGRWELDLDGDGRWSVPDVIANFGQAGDIPIAGDWNGDGIDQIGVYSRGKWILDSNGNGELDATDKVFEMGGAGDVPVVGDWDGDGVDEPGLYHQLRREAG